MSNGDRELDASASLSDAIENLRAELSRAHAAGKDEDIRFEVESIALELDVVLTRAASGEAKLEWKIPFFGGVGAEGAGRYEQGTERSHRLSLQLKVAPGPNGRSRQIAGVGKREE